MAVAVTSSGGNSVTTTETGGTTITVNESSTSVTVTPPASSSITVTEKGPKGDAGATGPAGPQGIQGIQGPAGADGGGNVSLDLSPQLGGNLDVQARSLFTSTTNGDIQFTPNGTGSINLDGTVKFKRFSTPPDPFEGGMYADNADNLYFGVSGS